MNNNRITPTIVFFLILTFQVIAQENPQYNLDDVVIVSSSRVPLSLKDIARDVTVIEKDEIAKAPVNTIEDLLSYASGLDMRQRGANGVQGDISIRGGSFEQTLILIDGIKVTDPQTGHHNLDLPVSLSEIERVEILKGSASKLYGPNAMSGIINIITNQDEKLSGSFEATAGDFGLYNSTVAFSLPLNNFTQRVSFSRNASEGYGNGNEYDISKMSYSSSIDLPDVAIDLSARYIEKEFGAYKFYSDRFPDEWENTETILLSSTINHSIKSFNNRLRVNWRRHNDDFILDRNNPEWYRNQHTTDQYGLEMQSSIATSYGTTVVGIELAKEKLQGNSLGDHKRNRTGLFVEHSQSLSDVTIVPGFSFYKYSDYDWEYYPGLDIGYQVNSEIRLYGSMGKSFRIPTYTELYYVSPANIGNPDLKPEESWTYEIGGKWSKEKFIFDLAYFIREGENLIDWSRVDAGDVWQVRNISELTTSGIDVEFIAFPKEIWGCKYINKIALSYSYLNADYSSGDYESKYILDHLEHQVVMKANIKFNNSINQMISGRYQRRFESDSYTIFDTRLSYKYNSLRLFIDVTNIFNQDYIEVGTIEMPGRWVKVGLNLDLFD